MYRLLSPSICAVFLLIACTRTPIPFAVASLDTPTAVPATAPRLSGDDETGIVLSWLEPGDNSASLYYATFEGGRWGAARTVVEDRDMFVNWADKPLVLPRGNGQFSAHWLEMSGEAAYAYDVVYVQSNDNGTSWSEPLTPHSDGIKTEHGFVSMYGDGQRTGLIWLDGRKYANEVTGDPVTSAMTLRAATISSELNIDDEQLVDEIICDCCQTDIAIAASGPVAVYRDRTPDEIRDISVTRLIDGKWQPGVLLHDDNWEIAGCPVNGPSLVASGNTVVVAWFSGANDRPVVQVAWSLDSAQTFARPIEVASANTLGRVGIVLLDDDTVAVSWVRPNAEGGAAVQLRKVSASGELGTAQTITGNAAAFSVPQIAKAGDNLVVVWTETADFVDSIHSASVSADAL